MTCGTPHPHPPAVCPHPAFCKPLFDQDQRAAGAVESLLATRPSGHVFCKQGTVIALLGGQASGGRSPSIPDPRPPPRDPRREEQAATCWDQGRTGWALPRVIRGEDADRAKVSKAALVLSHAAPGNHGNMRRAPPPRIFGFAVSEAPDEPSTRTNEDDGSSSLSCMFAVHSSLLRSRALGARLPDKETEAQGRLSPATE